MESFCNDIKGEPYEYTSRLFDQLVFIAPLFRLSESPDGKAKEWPLYDLENKQLMIFDEFDIHPEKESQRKIIDWDRTYFLTKYYCI